MARTCISLVTCLIIAQICFTSTNGKINQPILPDTPVSRVKLPKMFHEISYKGSIFSYASNDKDSVKHIRHYVLENEPIKNLEDSFIKHMTDVIVLKLARISSFDPLRLKSIRVEPTIGHDIFTINLSNIEIGGLSEVEIQDLKPRLNALKLRIALLFPRVTATGNFSVNGTVYNVVDVRGEGNAQLEYNDVLMRTQLNLVYHNNSFQIDSSDQPLVDFKSAQIKLSRDGSLNDTVDSGEASELGPLLFWVLADHVVQEVDDHLLRHINQYLLQFKVPESFKPAITWLMNRNMPGSITPFQIGRFSPLPFLNHWLNSLSQFRSPHINSRLFRR